MARMFTKIKELLFGKTERGQRYAVGIDLGTTKTAVGLRSLAEEGAGISYLMFPRGDRDSFENMPSVVALSSSNPESLNTGYAVLTGNEIIEKNWMFLRDEESLVNWGLFHQAKLSVGRRGFQPDDYPIELINRFPDVMPEHIMACLLTKVRLTFESKYSAPLDKATITIPASWDPERRRATALAAYMAGFKQIMLLEEPIAALLDAIDLTIFEGQQVVVVVVDFGGGTCDVAAVEIKENTIKLLGAAAQNCLGGELIDELLLKDLISKFTQHIEQRLKQTKDNDEEERLFKVLDYVETDPATRANLRKQLEQFKREINEKMQFSLPKIPKQEQAGASDVAAIDQAKQPEIGVDLEDELDNYFRSDPAAAKNGHWKHIEISRSLDIGNFIYELSFGEFEILLNEPQEKFSVKNDGANSPRSIVQTFDALLEGMKQEFLQNNQPDRVYLAGGSSHLYFVPQRVQKVLFENSRSAMAKSETNSLIEPIPYREQAVVRGATRFAYCKAKNLPTFVSRFFSDLELLTRPVKLLLKEGDEIPPDGIHFGPKIYESGVKTVIGPEQPIHLSYKRKGESFGLESIAKALHHEDPISPQDFFRLEVHVRPDNLISITGKHDTTGNPIIPKEDYPISVIEGLQEKVDYFKIHFSIS
jgi:hypothetical protein